ncbi:hypothetical protein EUX98_g4198 [Antrodiella citrinella]|uniref:Protein kinase domain-containing protein n=1 Tax=Antrodiella citrinella TaxID=2447956 RepID=A0A4S4MUK0_9APHY|nr:hypothetical protein EUX98_g4198 [Antrodiella citrinella]
MPRRKSVRQAQAAKSAGGGYDPEVAAKRTKRHLDELERSNYAETTGVVGDDEDVEPGGRSAKGRARQTISDKRVPEGGRKKKSTMNIRSAIIYKKNFSTLLEEAIRPDDIERTIQKAAESVEQFEAIYAKFNASTSQSLQEKHEADLRTQVSKLRRYGSQIKGWLAMKDIKDKALLKRWRKLIEMHLETFAALEKEQTRIETELQTARDPENQIDREKKLGLMKSLQSHISSLSLQHEQTDAAILSLRSGLKKKRQSSVDSTRVQGLEVLNHWRRWHLGKLEIALRLVDNNSVPLESVSVLQGHVEDLIGETMDEGLSYEDMEGILKESEGIYHEFASHDDRLKEGFTPTSDGSHSQASSSTSSLGPSSASHLLCDVDRLDLAQDNQTSGSLCRFESPADPQIPLLLKDMLKGALPESALTSLVDNDIQYIIDCVQNIFDTSSFHILVAVSDPEDERVVQRHLRRILLKLSLQYQILPLALFMLGVECQSLESTGFGGFADVFCGTHQGRKVALKRLRVFLMTDPSKRLQLQRDFYRESLLWRNLSHKHVLPLLGIDDKLFKQSFCMVLPWMEHGNIRHTMDDIRKNGTHTSLALFSRVEGWINEIALGLMYLHEEGIVHGDLRGANILIDSDWTVKLADFGMSLFADTSSNSYGSVRGGCVRWLAPEIIDPESFGSQSSRPTYASDVYSFACTVIELYTAEAPFAGSSEVAVIGLALAGKRPQRPRFHSEQLMADGIWSLLESAWAHSLQDRPNADTIVQELAKQYNTSV